MITRFSIVTLVIFIVSATLVICPLSFTIRLPYFGRTRISINLSTAPIFAIAILWASQCIGPTQIRNGIVGTEGIKPYNILLLFISLAYMAITLDITGVLQAAAFWVSNQGGSNTRKLFFYFYVMLALLSVALGNDPIILSGTAFLVYYTEAAGLEPIAWLIAEFAAANTSSMVLFVGNPTNVVICEGFGVNNAAFTAYTILPFLGCTVTCFIALAIQFRDKKYIARGSSVTEKLNVRTALRDPVGAWVGSILLGTCLAVIIVVSFFKIDVWMISLPFAVAKLVFDLFWDYHRFKKNPSSEDKPRDGQDPVVMELKRAMSASSAAGLGIPELQTKRVMSLQSGAAGLRIHETKRAQTLPVSAPISPSATTRTFPSITPPHSNDSSDATLLTHNHNTSKEEIQKSPSPKNFWNSWEGRKSYFTTRFPTLSTAFPRLPFALIPFAFSQFILIEGLAHQGWIDVFGHWLVKATKGQIYPTIWIIGVLGVVMCNVAGTNIGATILLTKIVRAAPGFSPQSTRAAAIALAISSNIGAVSFTFSASLAGLLWHSILGQKGIIVKQGTFAFWNLLPLAMMTTVGLGIVSAEMAVLYPGIR